MVWHYTYTQIKNSLLDVVDNSRVVPETNHFFLSFFKNIKTGNGEKPEQEAACAKTTGNRVHVTHLGVIIRSARRHVRCSRAGGWHKRCTIGENKGTPHELLHKRHWEALMRVGITRASVCRSFHGCWQSAGPASSWRKTVSGMSRGLVSWLLRSYKSADMRERKTEIEREMGLGVEWKKRERWTVDGWAKMMGERMSEKIVDKMTGM